MNKGLSCILLTALLGLTVLTGCFRSRRQQEWQYMPDMYVSPAVEAQEADGGSSLMRMPVEGNVPRGRTPYPHEPADTLDAQAMVNPLPFDRKVLDVGEKYFNIYCIVCHGPRGAGDGYIIPKMPRPNPLSSEKVRSWSDGRIFHVITHGQGNMPAYSSSIDQKTRWAIIHYLRVIQRAENPLPEDLE